MSDYIGRWIAIAILLLGMAVLLHGLLTRTDQVMRVEIKQMPDNVSFSH